MANKVNLVIAYAVIVNWKVIINLILLAVAVVVQTTGSYWTMLFLVIILKYFV